MVRHVSARAPCAGGISAVLWIALILAVPFNDSYNRAGFATALEQLPKDRPIGSDHIWVLGNLALVDPDLPLFDLARVDAVPGAAVLIVVRGQSGAVADRLGLPGDGLSANPFVLPDTKRRDTYAWFSVTP